MGDLKNVLCVLVWIQAFTIVRGQVVISIDTDTDVGIEWSPSWKCVDARCVRDDGTLVSNPEQGLRICHLTCGQYGSLWPKPTGHVTIGSDIIAFNPNQIAFTNKFISDDTESYIEAITHLFVKKLSKQCGVNCTLVPSTKIKVYLNIETDERNLVWVWMKGTV
ncbi:hypothetical protein WDU94_006969 [Cyamophila willieti]